MYGCQGDGEYGMVAAILNVDGADVAPSLLARMLAAGRPLTPDTEQPLTPTLERTWVNKHIGLGDARFSSPHEELPWRLVTPEASHQPMLAWDGRLDNRDDIVALLGSRWSAASDETLLLRAYSRWGAGCLKFLAGDFAFILWDDLANRLLAARDQLGVRPLHYAFDGKSLVIASRISQLFLGTQSSRQVHEPMVADYLADNWTSPNETLFRGVWRIPPAHVLQYDRNSTAPRIWRYWDVQASPTIEYRSDSDYTEHFSELVQQAVRSRLRTSKRVGVLLSGGLDSSAVAYSASGIIASTSEIRQQRLDTFTAVYDQFPDIDERRYVEPLVARCGCQPHYVVADELWTLRHDAPRLGAWDEPFENAFRKHFVQLSEEGRVLHGFA